MIFKKLLLSNVDLEDEADLCAKGLACYAATSTTKLANLSVELGGSMWLS